MLKKRILGALAALAIGTMVLTGCGDVGSAPEKSADKTPAAASQVDKSIPTSAIKVEGGHVEMSLFAGSLPQNTPTGEALGLMAEYINKNANGTIKAEAFYDTALGDATSMVQGLQQGTIDIGVCGTAYYSGLVPDVEVYQLPFLFEGLDAARAATARTSPSCQAVFAKMSDKGLVGLSFWENGFRELTNNVREVKTPDDLKGIKMRTLPAPVQVATWEAMGASATTIDAAELYTALQQGTVQAQDNPLHEIVARKFYEVQPYVTMTDATYTPLLLSMSKVTFDKLSPSQQQLIMEAADWAREKQIAITNEKQATALQTLKDHGCKIVENPDKKAFQDKAMASWELYTKPNGTAILDLIRK
jgi:TRAP transporter solute receptor, dctP family